MSILNKVFNLIGVEVDDTEDNYEEELLENNNMVSTPQDDELTEIGGKKNKVVKIHTTAQLKLVVIQPETFEEARDIAIHLKSKKPVVMNLENVDRDVQRRIVDFLSGVAYAKEGQIKRVANSTFIITPYNVEFEGDIMDELESSGVYF